MPYRNRVTPMGDIVAIPLRGAWTGNRGIVHTGHDIVRFHGGDHWITARCDSRAGTRSSGHLAALPGCSSTMKRSPSPPGTARLSRLLSTGPISGQSEARCSISLARYLRTKRSI